jgi:hypothetical protein
MTSRWFLPWEILESSDGVALEKQSLGQFRVRVFSDLTEYRTYYFFDGKDAVECFQNSRDAIKFEKSFMNSDL